MSDFVVGKRNLFCAGGGHGRSKPTAQPHAGRCTTGRYEHQNCLVPCRHPPGGRPPVSSYWHVWLWSLIGKAEFLGASAQAPSVLRGMYKVTQPLPHRSRKMPQCESYTRQASKVSKPNLHSPASPLSMIQSKLRLLLVSPTAQHPTIMQNVRASVFI